MKKIIFLTLSALLLFSCSEKANYDKISEMNGLHPIEIVYFESESEKELGEFPVSREIYSDLIIEIEKDKPAYVILKFFLDRETKEDEILSDTLDAYNNVLTQATTGLISKTDFADDVLRNLALQDMPMDIIDHEQIVLPNSTLLKGFSGIGMVDFVSENNEYLNYPIVSKIKGYLLPSLAIKVAMNILQSEPEITDDMLTIGAKQISISEGRLKLDLSEPDQLYRTYSFVDVLNRNPGEIDFSNKIVIIFIDNDSVRTIKSEYGNLHNPAEIVADSINTLLKKIDD